MTVDLSVSRSSLVSFCFMYFEALLLGAYTFKILMSSWSFYLYEMNIFLSGNTSCLEFYFV